MIIIHDVKQRSPEWYRLREDKWTGSTAIRLLQGKPRPTEYINYQSNAMVRGRLLEPVALREYEVITGITGLEVGFVTNTKYPYAGYSPDSITGDTLLEIKCLNGKRHEKLISGEILLDYLAQVHFGMVICELKKAKLLAFNPEYEQQLTIIDIPYDPSIATNIIARLDIDKLKNI